jgi:hypothetical protein
MPDIVGNFPGGSTVAENAPMISEVLPTVELTAGN